MGIHTSGDADTPPARDTEPLQQLVAGGGGAAKLHLLSVKWELEMRISSGHEGEA